MISSESWKECKKDLGLIYDMILVLSPLESDIKVSKNWVFDVCSWSDFIHGSSIIEGFTEGHWKMGGFNYPNCSNRLSLKLLE